VRQWRSEIEYDLVKEYLIHSYLYYVLCDTVISDYTFDSLCIELTQGWNEIESPFKDQVDVGDGPTVEGFQLKGQDGQEDSYSEEIKQVARIRLCEREEMLEIWKGIQP